MTIQAGLWQLRTEEEQTESGGITESVYDRYMYLVLDPIKAYPNSGTMLREIRLIFSNSTGFLASLSLIEGISTFSVSLLTTNYFMTALFNLFARVSAFAEAKIHQKDQLQLRYPDRECRQQMYTDAFIDAVPEMVNVLAGVCMFSKSWGINDIQELTHSAQFLGGIGTAAGYFAVATGRYIHGEAQINQEQEKAIDTQEKLINLRFLSSRQAIGVDAITSFPISMLLGTLSISALYLISTPFQPLTPDDKMVISGHLAVLSTLIFLNSFPRSVPLKSIFRRAPFIDEAINQHSADLADLGDSGDEEGGSVVFNVGRTWGDFFSDLKREGLSGSILLTSQVLMFYASYLKVQGNTDEAYTYMCLGLSLFGLSLANRHRHRVVPRISIDSILEIA